MARHSSYHFQQILFSFIHNCCKIHVIGTYFHDHVHVNIYFMETCFRLDQLFDAFAVAVDPSGEAGKLVGTVARNPVTGQDLPGKIM